jgi:uncharacterized protein (TIRG00374 family)
MERKKARTILMNSVMFAVGFIILAIMIYYIGIQEVARRMRDADLRFVILAFCLLFGVLSIKLTRWWVLLKKASFANASRVYLVGQATNLFAPIGTGEVMRAAVARTKLGIRARYTMAAVVIERISDITFLVAMAAICIVLFVPGQENYLFIIILIFILAVAYVLLFNPKFFDSLAVFIERTFEERGRFLSRLSSKISVSITKFKEALLEFHKRKAVLGVNVVLTVGSWIAEAVVTYILLLAFVDVEPSFIFIILVVNATSWVARTFLFLPVGPKEVTFTVFLAELSTISEETAGAVALIMLALNYIILGSGALVSAATFAPKKPEEDEEEDTAVDTVGEADLPG